MQMETSTEDFAAAFAGLPQGPQLKELVDIGVFFGRKKSKTNPKMRSCIFGNRGGIEIIDLVKTIEGIERAEGFVREVVRKAGVFLFVATQPAAADAALLAQELDVPRVEKRWVGGTLTNFSTILKRIEHFKKLKSDLAAGAFEKYTKKERLNLEREIKRLDELLGGLVNLARVPDVLIVIDPMLHTTAMREARRLRIPVVAFANTDSDPDLVDYLVPGNTAARKSIQWFLGRIGNAIREGRKTTPAAPVGTGETAKSDESKS